MPTVSTYASPITAVSAGEIVIDLPTSAIHKTHHFLSVSFFSDSGGSLPATPTGGTISYQAKLLGSRNFLDTNNSTQQAASAGVGDFSGNPTEVRCSFSSITGATHAMLILASNEN